MVFLARIKKNAVLWIVIRKKYVILTPNNIATMDLNIRANYDTSNMIHCRLNIYIEFTSN